ncbi:DUF421 domain-containing protein [Neobacillus kokaensis]|uniref:UPF0702 transmembrane protein YdfS n=1 Tax=Neobacillus kokaensis TaxID=2759023 RepID=A0ABQ3N564_9BACI|nr:DUF421 domain-containing protein [Neobacillus kokaensis]GHH99196.1 UPF0702 transmembrane protein YdfS [Neobacillus kokaensis]
MEEIVHAIVRTVVSISIVMVFSTWFGKQLNAHINLYNFALSIIIGSFIANMGFDINLKFLPMLAAFLTLVLIFFLFSFISSKSRIIRKWLSGRPVVIVENGKILDDNMKKIRYTLDDFNQQLRELGIFNIIEVEFAILEVSGKLSVMKKTKYQNATKQDVNPAIQNEEFNFPKELIMNGKIIKKNIDAHFSNAWLMNQLNQRNMKLADVHYAVISSTGHLFIDHYQDRIASPLDNE